MIVDDIGILKPPQAFRYSEASSGCRCVPAIRRTSVGACFLAGLSRRYSRPPQALRYSEASSGCLSLQDLLCWPASMQGLKRLKVSRLVTLDQ